MTVVPPGTEKLNALRERTVWQLLTDVAERFPAKEAFVAIDDDGLEYRVTYRELTERARRLSSGLVEIGVRRGDRLALLMTNLPEWLYVFFASLRVGAILVPLNTWFKPSEIEYALGQSRSRHVIALDRFRKVHFCGMLDQVCPEWSRTPAGNLLSASLPDLRTVTVLQRRAEPVGERAHDLGLLLEHGGSALSIAFAEAMEREVRPGDTSMIKYTSGSTGFPKGAMLEQGRAVANALLHTERLETDADDRWMSPGPFFHVGGSIWGLLSSVCRGSTLVFTEAYDPEQTLRLIQRERCTVNWGVPTMIRDEVALLRSGSYPIDSVRVSVAATPDVVEEVRSLLGAKTTFNPYGLTECYGVAALTGPTSPVGQQLTTNGTVLDGYACRAVDPTTGLDVAPGQVGEAWLFGNIMQGYWEKPVETAEAIDDDGWLHTGDLVTIDENRVITWVGRIKAMLKIGGENVAAEEVENCIAKYPGVLECILVGVADPRYDQIGRAYVVLEKDADVSEESLRAWCDERLARFKVPREFAFVAQLPLTGSGKPDRAAVQKLAETAAPAPAGTPAAT